MPALLFAWLLAWAVLSGAPVLLRLLYPVLTRVSAGCAAIKRLVGVLFFGLSPFKIESSRLNFYIEY